MSDKLKLSKISILIERIVCSLSSSFETLDVDGAIFVSPMPEIGRYAYQHKFFPKLPSAKLASLVSNFPRSLHEDLIDLYSNYNGLTLYNTVSIFGARNAPFPSPTSLDYGNVFEVPSGLPETSVVVGVHDLRDDACGYIVLDEGGFVGLTGSLEVYEICMSWESLGHFLEERVGFLSSIQGRIIQV